MINDTPASVGIIAERTNLKIVQIIETDEKYGFAISKKTGLTINSSAYIAEIFRAGIQSIERGQMEAARSLGMPQAAARVHVIIPQAVRRVIPPLTNEFIALIKDTALVIVLGATVVERELMTTARQSAAVTFSATPYMLRVTGTEAIPLRVRLLRPDTASTT